MAHITKIDSLDIGELQIYKSGNEAQLLHYFEPNGGLFIAESPMVVERALDAGYRPYSMLIEETLEIKNADNSPIPSILERCGNIPIYSGNAALLGRLTGFKLTRGMLCAMYRRQLPAIDDICRDSSRIAVLDGIENPTNVGAIFRNAAALGIDAILLTTDCSDPLYRRSLRVSMGTALMIPWTVMDRAVSETRASATDLFPPEIPEAVPGPSPSGPSSDTGRNTGCGNAGYIDCLHRLGFVVAAMALRDNSIPPDDNILKNAEKLAIVLGNEGFGLSGEVISKCDHTVMIPMQNGVDSLNVAAASAVAFWECGNQLRSGSTISVSI